MSEQIEIVAATRLNEAAFWQRTALGTSLRRLSFENRIVPHIFFQNRAPLGLLFNARLNAVSDSSVLIFVHDDVWIDDYFLYERVLDGVAAFDVIGVAGNRRRVKRQPAWSFVNERFEWDAKTNLSGRVAHGAHPFGPVSIYGPAPARCEILDGVFLAARKSVLVTSQVAFDARFDFHFYDMDFCRTAISSGLRLGTWPICITHQSGGAFGTPKWNELYGLYLSKWGD